jgi:gluconolactonase
MVDIPFGRILRYALRTGEWKEICKYDGEPNGLALRADGTLVIADYKQGIVSRITIADVYRNTPIASTLQVSDEQLSLDPKTGIISPVLTRRNLERFKGPNDIIVASNGDIYFTDQGQTGMTDPTGSVYRLSPTGKLDQLLSNGPSPNGLVLSPDEKVLYVAMTRSNAVWRCPLLPDGSTSKVMQFCAYPPRFPQSRE